MFLGLGWQQRVYFVGKGADKTVEAVAGGMAPAVKLLHAAVEQLACVAPTRASKILRREFLLGRPVHRRLWAALARGGRLVAPAELREVLQQLTDEELWLPDSYPELSELLALRFGELDSETQQELLARLRHGPGSELWLGVDADQARDWNLHSAVRQIQQIREAGAILPVEFNEWLDAKLAERPDLGAESAGDGLVSSREVEPERAEPDWELDSYGGRELLTELEGRLAREEPFYRGHAGNWFENRVTKVLATMTPGIGTDLDLPHVWRAFGWRHQPPDDERPNGSHRDATAEAAQVLELVATLSNEVVAENVEALVRWWGNWQTHIQPDSVSRRVWLRLWPCAINATNAGSSESPLDVAMGNTEAGVLACGVGRLAPKLRDEHRLSEDAEFGAILKAAVEAPGRAGLVALAWLVCDVGWYLQVDPTWTERYLVPALKECSPKERSESSIALWNALGRLGLAGGIPPVLATDAMELIERSDDPKLSQWSRQRFLSKFVRDALRAFFHDREPVVDALQLRQLISRLDAEMRSWCATELWRCLVNLGDDSPSPEKVFRKAVAPFLEQVWPQELDLVSRGVSHSMASIPAASRGEFAAAVDAVERFLVPGSVTSDIEYGLDSREDGEEDGKSPLRAIVDTEEKAGALLRLLDLTVGDGEGVSTPLGLDRLLAWIRKKSPELVERPEFARLTMLAQRSPFQ